MSAAIRFERLIPSAVAETTPVNRHPSIAEAPDCGGRSGEAPESREGQSFEAPDAGYGRMGYLEHEFTHGRSQS